MVGQNLSVGEKAKSSEKDLKGCKDKNGLSPKIYFLLHKFCCIHRTHSYCLISRSNVLESF